MHKINLKRAVVPALFGMVVLFSNSYGAISTEGDHLARQGRNYFSVSPKSSSYQGDSTVRYRTNGQIHGQEIQGSGRLITDPINGQNTNVITPQVEENRGSWFQRSPRTQNNNLYNTNPRARGTHSSDRTEFFQPFGHERRNDRVIMDRNLNNQRLDQRGRAIPQVSNLPSISEADLLLRLNKKSRALYRNLSPEGQELARQLAADIDGQDKTEAVQEAVRILHDQKMDEGREMLRNGMDRVHQPTEIENGKTKSRWFPFGN